VPTVVEWTKVGRVAGCGLRVSGGALRASGGLRVSESGFSSNPALANTSRQPCSTADSKSGGVDGSLCVTMRSPSNRTTSVKVPPVSMPILQVDESDGLLEEITRTPMGFIDRKNKRYQRFPWSSRTVGGRSPAFRLPAEL